ncbi:hypothetical protein CVT24_011890 [Panaeolus cyanescens]|uniref:ER-bound oxygenase mpaB/mpaB'/Rubber oxygenase catalytic domain-containing protein n=1 Tax=Panaeolus cyanescens TaxID=181874 RepID=A0A409YNL4_9AGAR|nr:hypothetical protein CVT24_011890 [Panaeolus cyanescens]
MDSWITILGSLSSNLGTRGLLHPLATKASILRLLGGSILSWVTLVRLLRWRRYHAIHKKYAAKWDNGRGKITPEEAQEIAQVSSLYDMPTLLNYALAFALFKTYSIPTISKILAATKELKSNETVSKRYADTEILIGTWFTCPISGFRDPEVAKKNVGPNAKPAEDPRAMIALARVNWLHSRYRITNDDYLYTLSLFILEPAVWAGRYGWRKTSPMEDHANFIFWSEIGRRMNITNIPETIDELKQWCAAYEERCMVPADSNLEVAQATIDELMSAAPEAFGIKSLGNRAIIAMLEDNVREAMMLPKQPWYIGSTIKNAMRTVAFIQRWFMLPRINPRLPVDIGPPKLFDGSCPRLRPNKFAARPWYREQRAGAGYYWDRLLVASGWHDEMPGPHLKSSGYRIEELGPVKYENKLMDGLIPLLEKIYTHALNVVNTAWQHSTIPGLVLGGVLGWVVLVRALRWRRYYAIHKTYGPKWDNGRGTISPGEAQKIMAVSTQYDMPLLLNYSLAFALFKTYAIPSISQLLSSTKQLSSPAMVSRRYADALTNTLYEQTELLIATWVGCPITGFQDLELAAKNTGPNAKPAEDPRANIAIARTNWLHSKYKISNDDYLYTLCLFILEPARWAEKYGWRQLSPLEKEAFYIFWYEVAGRMGIKDVPESLAELEAWSNAYEDRCMLPADSNKQVALHTIDELLSAVPTTFGLKTFAQKGVIAVLDDNVRDAMMQPKQPKYMATLMNSSMAMVAFVQRWFMLPRSNNNFRYPVDVRLPIKDGKVGPRMVPNKFAARPWYRPEHSGVFKIWDRMLVKIGWHQELPGPHLRSSGYRLEEMGPLQFENSGREEIMRMAAELQGCPIASIWAEEANQQA